MFEEKEKAESYKNIYVKEEEDLFKKKIYLSILVETKWHYHHHHHHWITKRMNLIESYPGISY